MYHIILCVALCSLASGQPLPFYGGGGLNSPHNSLQPYVPGRYPLGAGYNGQFHNPASGTVPILSYSNERGPDGSYSFSFATGDGKQAQETGFLKNAFIDQTGTPQGTQAVEGSFSYTTPEGIPIQVRYVADENGFRPSGDHIPADGKGVLPGGVLPGSNLPGGILTGGLLPGGALPGGLIPGIAQGGFGNGNRPFNQGLNGYSPYNYGNNYNRNPLNYGNFGNIRNPFNSPYNPIKH